MSEDTGEDNSNLNNIAVNFVESLFNFESDDIDNTSLPKKGHNNSMHEIKKTNKKTKSLEKKPKLNQNNIKNSQKKNGSKITPSYPQTSAKSLKKNSNNNINDLDRKILFTEQNTKTDYLTKSVRQIKKQPTKDKKIDFKTEGNKLNKTSSTTEIYKAKLDSIKEKKLYEERVKILRNHINLLKKQEIELNKKMEQAREKEKGKNKIKKEKYDNKKFLLSAEIDKRKALEEKKKIISETKKQNVINLKESQERNKNEKINNYKQAYNDRKKAEEIRIEKNNIVEQKNHIQIEKIKNEREKNKERNIQKKYDNKNKMSKTYKKSYEENMNETQKLKDELSKLESMEDHYLQNIQKTQEYIKQNNDENDIKFSKYKKIKFDNNSNNNYNYKGKVRRASSTATSEKRRNKNKNFEKIDDVQF